MKTIRLKTNSGCPLLAHNFYSRFEIISISIRIVTIPILWIGLHPAFFHRFHGYLVPDGIVTETFSPGIMMHRAITHRLHRMHNSYVCHELWTGASTGASTPPTGRGVAILSLFFPLSLSFRSFFFFFPRSVAIFDPFLAATHVTTRLSWDIFVRSSRAFAEEIAARGHREWQSATRNLHLSSPLIPFNPTYKHSVARYLDSLTLPRWIVANRFIGIYIFFFLKKRNLSFRSIFLFPSIVIRERNVDWKLERNHRGRSFFFTINFKRLHRNVDWSFVRFSFSFNCN